MWKKIVILYLSDEGHKLARKLRGLLGEVQLIRPQSGVDQALEEVWGLTDGIICLMATGIVVRSVSRLCENKRKDPGILVLDDKGTFVISLLSGHLGGANEMAHTIAALIDAQPIVTTASDVRGNTPLDIWLSDHELVVNNDRLLTGCIMVLINKGFINCFIDLVHIDLPPDFKVVQKPKHADLIISNWLYPEIDCLQACPRNLVLGLGCKRNTRSDEIEKAFLLLLSQENIPLGSILSIATIDLKIDEEGILQFAQKRGLSVEFFTKQRLNSVENITPSEKVMAAVGAKGVAEPAAMLAAAKRFSHSEIIVKKQKLKNITLAIARGIN